MKGRLVVLEGLDGTGKTTQHKRLLTRLAAADIRFASASFPRYDRPSGGVISEYLQGGFGKNPGDVNAYAASSFYAVDRFASFRQEAWGEAYRGGALAVLARYSTSNAIHQGAKLPKGERAAFFAWLADYEYGKLGLPEPDLVLYLTAPLDAALAQIASRAAKENLPADIHESNRAYFAACAESGAEAAAMFGWKVIDVMENGTFRPVEEIHQMIYGAMQAANLL